MRKSSDADRRDGDSRVRGAKDAYELRAADLFYVKQNDDCRAKLLCLLNIKHFYQTNKTHTVQY